MGPPDVSVVGVLIPRSPPEICQLLGLLYRCARASARGARRPQSKLTSSPSQSARGARASPRCGSALAARAVRNRLRPRDGQPHAALPHGLRALRLLLAVARAFDDRVAACRLRARRRARCGRERRRRCARCASSSPSPCARCASSSPSPCASSPSLVQSMWTLSRPAGCVRGGVRGGVRAAGGSGGSGGASSSASSSSPSGGAVPCSSSSSMNSASERTMNTSKPDRSSLECIFF
jgi:hypothetical protein